MNHFTIARVIHILAIVVWIGGVAMVTTVIIPAVKRMKSKTDKVNTFEELEGRFSFQAKITTLLTAISGFYMIYELDAWNRYFDLKYWWFWAMTIVWLLFTLVLFVLEPFILHKLYKKYANNNPETTFEFIHKFHIILLSISLITIAGAMAGSHGLFFVK
ncbi:MAG: hypothetical protein ACPGRC_07220 [Salibacteraceae bacterium]